MKPNKLDSHIKNTLKSRAIAPATSAWDRLFVQLNEQPAQKNRGWFFYIGAAASVLVLISLGIQLFSNKNESIPMKNKIVIEQIDTKLVEDTLEIFQNENPIEERIVEIDLEEKQHMINSENDKSPLPIKKNKLELSPKQNRSIAKNEFKQDTSIHKILSLVSTVKKESKVIVSANKEQIQVEEIFKNKPKSTIKVNSQDLLYAVTHSQEEVTAYYAKHNLSSATILAIIKSELKKSNLKVNPNTILAEVERTIKNVEFENNFLQSLQKRVATLTMVIASRND
tara:strand:+ start:2042 stop:2890 length:849 start_codon:yes stop_codon:yes gene_type:complete